MRNGDCAYLEVIFLLIDEASIHGRIVESLVRDHVHLQLSEGLLVRVVQRIPHFLLEFREFDDLETRFSYKINS